MRIKFSSFTFVLCSLFLKVTFFQKVWFVFQTSKPPKKIFQKIILRLNVIGGKFKFQVQDSFLEFVFLEIRNHTFWRKATFNRNVSWKCMNLNCIIILERILSNCVADCAHPMQYPMMITVAPERNFFREAHIFFSSFFTKIQKV